MSRPAGRLLQMLELLQERPEVGGAELAGALDVDPRTVRRYATRLQELGLPVEARRGRHGGYRLRPGWRMPPLVLRDDEAAAVVLGLLAVEHLGLGAQDALAKVRRVLPEGLRDRVGALADVTATTRRPPPGEPPDTATLLALAGAIARRRAVRATYTPRAGEPGLRLLDPYGLVLHGGRWYLAAEDSRSDEIRTYRVDRMAQVRERSRATTPPPGFDAAEHVARSLARVPWRHEVEVILHETTIDEVRRWVPADVAELEPHATTARDLVLRARAERLDGMARVLASLGTPFTVVRPDELRDDLRALARMLEAA